MKGRHDHTLTEDECFFMHTNSADAGLPHTSLTDHIADLEARMSQIARLGDELATILRRVEAEWPKTHACAIDAAQTKIDLIRALAV